MIEVLVLIIVFILLLLGIIWGHFLRGQQGNETAADVRENTNVDLYKEHKAEIEKDYAEGSIDKENYEYLLAELDKSLLQDIEQGGKTGSVEQRKMTMFWPISLSLFVLIFSLVMYSKQGAYKQLSQPRNDFDANQQIAAQQQNHDRFNQLLAQVEAEPNNADAWFNLAQLYISAGQFMKAIEAYDKVIALEGEHPDLLGMKAQALYFAAEGNLTPGVQALIDKALSMDANEPSTNILLGMHYFGQQSYQLAIDYWQKVMDSGRQSVNTQALGELLAEAKSRLSLTGNSTTPEITDQGPQLRLKIELSEEFSEQLNQGEDKVVFVYAVPAAGGRMPVAAVKIMASDLPAEVVLNDARAMSPQMKLSSVDAVNILAVVSQLGGAGIKPGDFKAQLDNVDVSTRDTLLLSIDTLVE
ncbi:c-type cytochrome biogenesis protein CcmI [Thalassotalea euphylliae]|uniref:c-type cytochrome biogenesis protein CcmI n=1 Tax=Thalassotalea euphylliae TaxID=1655234 RepID=UPI00364451D5